MSKRHPVVTEQADGMVFAGDCAVCHAAMYRLHTRGRRPSHHDGECAKAEREAEKRAARDAQAAARAEAKAARKGK